MNYVVGVRFSLEVFGQDKNECWVGKTCLIIGKVYYVVLISDFRYG